MPLIDILKERYNEGYITVFFHEVGEQREFMQFSYKNIIYMATKFKERSSVSVYVLSDIIKEGKDNE